VVHKSYFRILFRILYITTSALSHFRISTPLCIRFVFISFVEEYLNIVLHMVAVIDQRVIKCRFIGEFLYYSVSFLTIFFQ